MEDAKSLRHLTRDAKFVRYQIDHSRRYDNVNKFYGFSATQKTSPLFIRAIGVDGGILLLSTKRPYSR